MNIDQLIKHIEEVVSGVNNGTILERPPKLFGYNDGSNLHNISNETKAQKLSIIKDFIVSLGFEYDNISQQKRLQKEELINNINKLKDTSIFTNAKAYQELLGTTSKKIQHIFAPDATLKSKFGFINSVLRQCGFSMVLIRKQENQGNKTHYYSLRALEEK